jgi:CheY-like chemotaxis protein
VSSGTQAQSEGPLAGVRVLIVEDEYLLAMLLEDELLSAGCTIVDVASNLEKAHEAVRRGAFDVALLDVNLGGETVYPVADALAQAGIAFVFLSGYGAGNFPERFQDRPRVGKPYEIGELLREISRSLGKI